ncbi:hypothetical protein SMQE30_15030 [Serratia marcescens]|nr:hypothetical protein SMQE30_15030 [Serratia marcescens]
MKRFSLSEYVDLYGQAKTANRIGACREIRRWIYDAGRDCRIRSNNCYGQILRRDQEAELACWGLDK